MPASAAPSQFVELFEPRWPAHECFGLVIGYCSLDYSSSDFELREAAKGVTGWRKETAGGCVDRLRVSNKNERRDGSRDLSAEARQSMANITPGRSRT